MQTITGTVDRINFRNEESAWTAFLLYTDTGPVRATGIIPTIRLGMTLRLTGDTEQTRYGPSFKAAECAEVQPSDREGIEKYLASGLIKNIGPKLAHEIVATFGDDTLQVLDNDPERLREVYGIGAKRVESIIASVKEQTQIRSIMIWLKRYDLSNALAAKIYKQYGDEAIHVLEENPYRLADDLSGIGFHKADDVAKRLGLHPESAFRIHSGILAVLGDWAAEGNTCMDREDLIQRAASADYLSLPADTVETGLRKDSSGLVIDEEDVYLAQYYHAEKHIAKKLTALSRVKDDGSVPEFKTLRAESGMDYSIEQRSAIRHALLGHVLVITGGPGTGKTVTTNAIIREWERLGLRVLLAAPTGRAAKRMSEVTGREAATIHRLLGYQNGAFMHDADTPLEGDALIIDEVSMVDTLLMRHLLDAVPERMRLVLVGDVDQLPSVGPGCILRDIIDAGTVPVCRLTEIYRQAQGSQIIMNAHAVNEGRAPATDNPEGTDFWFFRCEDKLQIPRLIVDLVSRKIPDKFGCTPDDIQVLSPMKREFDPIGSTQLARLIQEVLNPSGECVGKKGDTEFRVGDRIMQVKNDYDKGIFNGDIGVILSKENEQDEEKTLFVASFDDNPVRMTRSDIKNIELAYACTVHKSQGSEYPVVVIPVHESQYVMLKRNLLYTGITRAKRQCILVGTRKAAAIAAQNEETRRRSTRLKEKLLSLNDN